MLGGLKWADFSDKNSLFWIDQEIRKYSSKCSLWYEHEDPYLYLYHNTCACMYIDRIPGRQEGEIFSI